MSEGILMILNLYWNYFWFSLWKISICHPKKLLHYCQTKVSILHISWQKGSKDSLNTLRLSYHSYHATLKKSFNSARSTSRTSFFSCVPWNRLLSVNHNQSHQVVFHFCSSSCFTILYNRDCKFFRLTC